MLFDTLCLLPTDRVVLSDLFVFFSKALHYLYI